MGKKMRRNFSFHHPQTTAPIIIGVFCCHVQLGLLLSVFTWGLASGLQLGFDFMSSIFIEMISLDYRIIIQIKLDQIGSDWIKLDQIGSDWIRLDQIGSDWIRLDQIGSDWNRLDQTWSNLKKLETIGSNWIKLDEVGLN